MGLGLYARHDRMNRCAVLEAVRCNIHCQSEVRSCRMSVFQSASHDTIEWTESSSPTDTPCLTLGHGPSAFPTPNSGYCAVFGRPGPIGSSGVCLSLALADGHVAKACSAQYHHHHEDFSSACGHGLATGSAASFAPTGVFSGSSVRLRTKIIIIPELVPKNVRSHADAFVN